MDMMTKFRKFALSIIIISAGWFAGANCHAQFPGDVFFENPSLSAEQNQLVELDLHAFSGSSVFGAAQVEIHFAETEIEVASVEAGESEISKYFEFKEIPEGLAIIAINGVSAERPIGSVELAKIHVKPIAPPGSTVNISSHIVSMLDQSAASLESSSGYSAEIIVEPLISASTARSLQFVGSKASADSDSQSLQNRAMRLRPEGSTVNLMTIEGGRVVPRTVETGSGEAEEVIYP